MNYTVVIRTLGNTGEKYQTLLQSIKAQTLPPKEIIVVLPFGYKVDYQMGSERFIFTDKGMVSQRAVGIQNVQTEYMLVVDDDLEFGPDFVEDLYRWGIQNQLDCVLPMEGILAPNSTKIDLRYPLKIRLRGAFTGQLFQVYRKSPFLDKITATAGHCVYLNSNDLDQCYFVATGNFQCFFIKTEVAKNVHFEDEIWLQQGTLSQYAAYDDPSFFYKSYLQGSRIAY